MASLNKLDLLFCLHFVPAQTCLLHLSFPTAIKTCISLPRKQIAIHPQKLKVKSINSRKVGLQQCCFCPNECGDGFATNHLFDLVGFLKVVCTSIFCSCVELDLMQWVETLSTVLDWIWLTE